MKYVLVKHIEDAVKQYHKDISVFRVSINPIIKEIKNVINGMDEHDFIEAVDVFRVFIDNDLKMRSASFLVFKNLLKKTVLVPDGLLARRSVDNKLYDFYIHLKYLNSKVFNKERFNNDLQKLFIDYYTKKETVFLKETLFGIASDGQNNINQSLVMQFIKLKIFFHHLDGYLNDNGKALSLDKTKVLFNGLNIDLSSSTYPESIFKQSDLWEKAPNAFNRFILGLDNLNTESFRFDRDNIDGFLDSIAKTQSSSIVEFFSGSENRKLQTYYKDALYSIDGIIDDIIGDFAVYNTYKRSVIFDYSNVKNYSFFQLITQSRSDIDIKLLLLQLLIKSNLESNHGWEQNFIDRCMAEDSTNHNWEFRLITELLSPEYSRYRSEYIQHWQYFAHLSSKSKKYELHDFFLDALDENSSNFSKNNMLMKMWSDFYRDKGESIELYSSYLTQFNKFYKSLGEYFRYDKKLKLTEFKLRKPIKKNELPKNRASSLLIVPVFTHISNRDIKLGIIKSKDNPRFYHMFHYVAKEHNSRLKTVMRKKECLIGSTATNVKNITKIASSGFLAGPRQRFGRGQYFSDIGNGTDVLSPTIGNNGYYDKVSNPPTGNPNGEETTSAYAEQIRKDGGRPATLVAKVHALDERPVVLLDSRRNHKAAFNLRRHYNTSAVIMTHIDNTNMRYLIANSPAFGARYKGDQLMPEVVGCHIDPQDKI